MNRLCGCAILLAGLLLTQMAWAQATSFNVTTSGVTSFEFDPGGSNPALTLQRGRTYSFNLNTPGHPFWIKTTQVTGSGSAYNSGIGGVGNGAQSGTLTFTVPLEAPDTLYYNCEFHAPMTGILNIVDAPRAADFDGDGRSDIFWRNSTTGENYVYPMNGTAILTSEGYARTVADQNWQVVGIGDFNGDRRADLLWRNSSTGENYIYLMNGKDISGESYLRTVADQNWKVAGVGDLDGDGKADIVWRNSATGENYLYPMDGLSIKPGEGYLRTVADQNWRVAGVGDFDNDAKSDILWRNAATGENYLYPMSGTAILGTEGYLRTVVDLNWKILGTGDFDGNGTSDVLWRNSLTGENYVYPMNGTAILGTESYLRTVADLDWKVAGTSDYDGDGKADVLWRNAATGENYLYFMDGTTIKPTEGYIRTVADQNWQVVGGRDDSRSFPVSACVSTAADSSQNTDGSANRINSAFIGSPTYGAFSLPRKKLNGNSVNIDYMVHEPPGVPKALLVLIAGGQLTAFITGAGDGAAVSTAGGNFLVRSAHLFAAKGYRVLTMDRPDDWNDYTQGSGSGSAYDGYRTSQEHAVDLSSMIGRVNTSGLPVIILGTSRGAISAVAQHALGAAISISSPVTVGNGSPISTADAASVTAPAHVIWHVQDACSVTPPTDAAALVSAFTDGTGDAVEGGFNDTVVVDPCGAFSFHGFLGIESCAVNEITTWTDSALATIAPTRPRAASGSETATMNTQKIVDLSALGGSTAGGALTYSLPHASTSLGGSVSIGGTLVTYDPPAGVSGTVDTFVYVVTETGGGTSHSHVEVTITP